MPMQWGAPPPHKLYKGSIHLLCIRYGQSVDVAILGPMMGLETHWVGSRTMPCFGVDCKHCDYPKTWKGFSPVLAANLSWNGPAKGRFEWVLVVTEEIGEEFARFQRGEVVTVARPGRKKNGPLRCSLKAGQKPLVDLPDTFDVRPYVVRACGFSQSASARLRLAT
jgi:hypothetical protein